MDIIINTVKAIEKYKISVLFNDGTKGIINLSHLAGKGIFSYWDEDNNFEKVFINKENNAIAWSEYLEIDTLNCYLTIRGIDFDEYINSNIKESHAFS